MRFVIRGGKKLSGEIKVNGAKNSVLKAMAASLLFDSPLSIENVPAIEDVFRMAELLEGLGVKIENRETEDKEKFRENQRLVRVDPRFAKQTLEIDPRGVAKFELDKEIAKRLRASMVLVGPLLARTGKASFPYPGGCVIGKRPIDVFLDGWQVMGAEVKEEKGNGFQLKAKKLKGVDFTFRVVSVTGTETLMMTAVLAHGKTVLRNAALEPEVAALAEFLNASGADIRGAGTPTVEIIGTAGRLLRAMSPFAVMPDRIEAGSFLILGAALGGKVKVVGCNPGHMTAVLAKLQDAGVDLKIEGSSVTVSRPRKLFATNLQTREYPGFPTDLQAPFAVLMTQAHGASPVRGREGSQRVPASNGESIIFETIFENRFGYVEDLKRMGADIFLADPHRIIVRGPTPLHAREIEGPDLRAGLALIVAALMAKGGSIVGNVYQIERGYEKIDERLRGLGAEIERVE